MCMEGVNDPWWLQKARPSTGHSDGAASPFLQFCTIYGARHGDAVRSFTFALQGGKCLHPPPLSAINSGPASMVYNMQLI